MSPILSALVPPRCGCNDEPMIEDTSALDRAMGFRRFTCLECGFCVLAHDEPEPRLPSAPTDAPAGSPAKIDVMCERECLGVSLFHPLDCPLTIHAEPHQKGPRVTSGLPRGVSYNEGRGMYLARKGGAFRGWHATAELAAAAVGGVG